MITVFYFFMVSGHGLFFCCFFVAGVQFLYTTVFGVFAAFIFLRTREREVLIASDSHFYSPASHH